MMFSPIRAALELAIYQQVNQGNQDNYAKEPEKNAVQRRKRGSIYSYRAAWPKEDLAHLEAAERLLNDLRKKGIRGVSREDVLTPDQLRCLRASYNEKSHEKKLRKMGMQQDAQEPVQLSGPVVMPAIAHEEQQLCVAYDSSLEPAFSEQFALLKDVGCMEMAPEISPTGVLTYSYSECLRQKELEKQRESYDETSSYRAMLSAENQAHLKNAEQKLRAFKKQGVCNPRKQLLPIELACLRAFEAYSARKYQGKKRQELSISQPTQLPVPVEMSVIRNKKRKHCVEGVVLAEKKMAYEGEVSEEADGFADFLCAGEVQRLVDKQSEHMCFMSRDESKEENLKKLHEGTILPLAKVADHNDNKRMLLTPAELKHELKKERNKLRMRETRANMSLEKYQEVMKKEWQRQCKKMKAMSEEERFLFEQRRAEQRRKSSEAKKQKREEEFVVSLFSNI